MNVTVIKACECPAAGWCARHRVNKTENWHKLCQTSLKFREMWDQGNGPGQNSDSPPTYKEPELPPLPPPKFIRWISRFRKSDDVGPGDTFERIAERFQGKHIVALMEKLGMEDCGCGERKKRWNRDWPYWRWIDGWQKK